jgi:DNA-binding NarL/FixJ family response regulator
VSRGGTYVDAMLTATADASDEALAPELTQRDRDVLRLLARGEGYEEIGAALFISTAAVRKLMGRIKTKLGVATPTEAVAVALRQSLIT